jgi:hypothetical protein
MPQYIKTFDDALSQELCSQLIKKFDQDKRTQADPQPEYSKRHYIYTSDKADWANLNQEVSLVANELTEAYFYRPGRLRLTSPSDWFDDGWVMARYDSGDTCALHDDAQSSEPGNNGLRYATILFYLNDTEGGETSFPMQEVQISPKRGRAIMFPAMLTHPHEVLRSEAKRYIYQTWIVDTELKVVLEE